MPRLAHGTLARIYADFDTVNRALAAVDIASSVYHETLPTSPRTAVAVGEKYFLRAGNSLAATTILIERPGYTLVKVVATGAREGILDFFDLGSSRDYTAMIVEKIAKAANAHYEIIKEVDHMDRGKTSLLQE